MKIEAETDKTLGVGSQAAAVQSITELALRAHGCAHKVEAVLLPFAVKRVVRRDEDGVALRVVVGFRWTALDHLALLCEAREWMGRWERMSELAFA